MCCGGMCSILLLPLVARCLETIDVCVWRMFVFTSVVVIVWGIILKCKYLHNSITFCVDTCTVSVLLLFYFFLIFLTAALLFIYFQSYFFYIFGPTFS